MQFSLKEEQKPVFYSNAEKRGIELPTRKEIREATFDTVHYDLKPGETLKYAPKVENYVDVIDEIRKKGVNLQSKRRRSYRGSNGLWVEGLDDYVKRLKDIRDGKAERDYSVSAVISDRSNRSALRYYNESILQRTKKEKNSNVSDVSKDFGAGLPTGGVRGLSVFTEGERKELDQAILAGEQEIARRDAAAKEIKEKYGVKENGEISIENLTRLFGDINKSKGAAELFDKVVNVLGKNTDGIYIGDASKGFAAGEFNIPSGDVRLP